MKIAQIQLHTYNDKYENYRNLEFFFEKAASYSVDMITVGEMFACPYKTDLFSIYAEPEGGALWQICSNLAKKFHIIFSAGTIPEIGENGKLYNTAYVFGRDGTQIAKYRKIHLFDIDIPGKQTFKESDTLAPGSDIMVFDTEFGKIGICICFDIRFPEQSRKMAEIGAKIILCPAAFNSVTGPMHWETLFKARAIDNECFFVGTSSALDESFSYHSYGHSIIVSPWGKVLNQMGVEEGLQITEINLNEVIDMRNSIPIGL